jgi:zinc transport system ATP-binding protein
MTSKPDPVLEIVGLSIEIAGRTIVRDATFSLPRGADLAVIGPNGSGKTVLLKTLLGLLPASGTISWAPDSRRGYVPQKVFADPHLPMRVKELLKAKASVQHFKDSDIESAVAWVGITDLMAQRLGALSSGQLQRVLLAMAMVGSPNVLLVDEPTSSLDEAAEGHIYELLQRTRQTRGTTVILVSHDLALVHNMATHVLCLNGGRASFGTAQEMLTQDILESLYGCPLQFHSHAWEKKP